MRAWRIVLTLALALTCSPRVGAQNAPAAQPSASPASPGTFVDNSLASIVLEHREDWNLTPAQVKTLETLQADLQKANIQQNAALQVAEIELAELRRRTPADRNQVELKVRQAEALRGDLRLAEIRTADRVKAALTPEQRAKLEPLERRLAALPPEVGTEATVRQQVQAALKDETKDQKVVEIETAQAIVSRISDWTKLWGFSVGIPMLMLVSILTVLGLRNYADLKERMKAAKDEIEKQSKATLQEAQTQTETLKKTAAQQTRLLQQEAKRAETIRKEGDRLLTDYQSLKAKLGDVNKLAQDVESLSHRVEKVEKVTFTPSDALTPELQQTLDTALASFQDYLRSLGYQATKEKVTVFIDPNVRDNAFYDNQHDVIVVSPQLAGDVDVIFREYSHHVLVSFVKEPYQNWNLAFNGVESGLADYFPCSYQNDPALGEIAAAFYRQRSSEERFKRGYIRNLDNNRSFREIGPQTMQQDAGEVWGGAFWKLRERLGQEKTDRLLLATWAAVQALPERQRDDFGLLFVNKLLELAEAEEGEKEAAAIRALFKRRGMKL